MVKKPFFCVFAVSLLAGSGLVVTPLAAAPAEGDSSPAEATDVNAQAVPERAPDAATARTPIADEAALAAAKKSAEEAYKNARKLFKDGKYAAALAQYQLSGRLFPTWSSRTGAGACLVKLQRYDEALDIFEGALRDFNDTLPPKTKASALEQIDLMRTATGAVMVTGAEIGAIVLVDGHHRGDHPLTAPLTTLSGPHFIRVYKEGYAVFEKDVQIAKGQMETLAVKLTPLPNAGRLKVGEVGGKKMEVVVDGVPVGVTPWEGPVGPGEHSVLLRPMTAPPDARQTMCGGPASASGIRANAEDEEFGALPVMVVVESGKTTPIQLKAEPLAAAVRIMPVPPDAAVYIDGVFVGRGGFTGRVKPGEHVVKMVADGFVPVVQKMNVDAGDESSPPSNLRKDLNAPRWANRGQFLFEITGGVPLAPTFGGEIAQGCTDLCQQDLGTGGRAALRGGYEFGNGFGFGLSAGWLRMEQSITGRDTSVNLASGNTIGTANDTVLLQDFMGGAFASLRLGKRFPVRFGLGAGVAFGSVNVTRTGIFENRASGPAVQSGNFFWFYVEPELRVGVRVTEHLTLGVGVSALVLATPRIPLWTAKMAINAHSEADEYGTFEAETVTGAAIFAISQGIHVQYGF